MAASTQNTAIGPTKYDAMPAITAAVALPAWLKASFRPTRRAKALGPTIPSVMAAHSLHQSDKRKLRQEREQQGSARDRDGGADNNASLQVSRVDEGTCRCLGEKPCDAADRHDKTDAPSIPLLNCQQVDSEVGAKSVAHIRKEEVHPIKRSRNSGHNSWSDHPLSKQVPVNTSVKHRRAILRSRDS